MTFWQLVLADVVALVIVAAVAGLIWLVPRLPDIIHGIKVVRRIDRNLKQLAKDKADGKLDE